MPTSRTADSRYLKTVRSTRWNGHRLRLTDRHPGEQNDQQRVYTTIQHDKHTNDSGNIHRQEMKNKRLEDKMYLPCYDRY